MSFRFFIYYCALCGGWAALLGWVLGRMLSPGNSENPWGQAGIRGLGLGLMVALGLSLVDSLWNLSVRNVGQIALRVGVAVLVGALGGLLGGIMGQFLSGGLPTVLLVVGWTLTGLLVGASIGAWEVLQGLIQKKNVAGATRKLVKCLIGGTLGGVLGGFLTLVLRLMSRSLFPGKEEGWLWTPTALGFVALGMCIGLLVGLAQVILKEAWIKVEAGFRPGREMILAKEKTVIGRAEGTDIALFGDAGVEKQHAQIILNDGRYYLEEPAATPGGTFVNEQKVAQRTPLKSGDLIRMGRSVLRFMEKQKR